MVIFYVLVMAFGISRFDLDLTLESGQFQNHEMNQIPQDHPLDPPTEENTWDDQDLVNKHEIMAPIFLYVLKNKTLIIFFYKSLSHPVFSPPPETNPVCSSFPLV